METYMDAINELAGKSREELRTIADRFAAIALENLGDLDFKEACYTILSTVLATVSADGYFNYDEFYVAQPVIAAIFGDGYDYDKTLNLIRKIGIDSDRARNAMDYFVDHVDSKAKSALFFLCAALCAADRTVNDKELDWLEKLLG